MPKKISIFNNANPPAEGESFETLFQKSNVTIKRIVSSSKIDKEVMIQEEDEWFIVISGTATIMIEDKKIVLERGDYCFVERKMAHSLIDVREGTIWLAVHIE
jgi:cupin 2 domain-containing protein